MKTNLTTAERDELAALEGRKLDTYVGFNVIRHFFSKRSDAERFMTLRIKDGAYRPVYYGCECEFEVRRCGECYEFAEG